MSEHTTHSCTKPRPAQRLFFLIMLLGFSGCSFLRAQAPFAVSVGGSNSDLAFTLVQLPDSSYMVAGETNSFGAGATDMYVVRFTTRGQLIWSRTVGGLNADNARSMVEAGGGSVLIAGTTRSFGAGGEDIYLVKMDSTGNIIWTKTYGGTGDDRAWKIIRTSDGGYAIAGVSSSSPAKGQDMYLLKTDADGEKQWEKLVDGVSAGMMNYSDIGYTVTEINNGNLVLCGTTVTGSPYNTQLFLSQFGSDGSLIWSKKLADPGLNIGFSSFARAVVPTADGGFLLGAEVALPCENGFIECNVGPGGNWHFYLAKFNSDGNKLWTKMFGGGTVSGVSNDASDYLKDITPTADGSYVVCGYSYAFRKDFSTNKQKGLEYFLVKISDEGSIIWTKVFGNELNENGQAIIQTLGGAYAIAGYTYPQQAGEPAEQLSLTRLDAGGNSCLQTRVGGKIMTGGGILSNMGTVQDGNSSQANGGLSGQGGVLTDLCAGSMVLSVDAQNSCSDTCNGRATVQVSGGQPPFTYTWMPGNISGESPEGLCAGTYTVTVSDGQGSSTAYDVVIGMEPSGLEVQANGSLQICEGQTVMLTAESGYSQYRWNGIAGNQELETGSSGAYQATAVSSEGCLLHSDSIFVEVSEKPSAGFSYSQPYGYTIQFTDESQHAQSWSWLFGDGNSSTEQNPVNTYPYDDTYPAQLIVTNECGSDTINMDVVVEKTNGLLDPDGSMVNIRFAREGQWLRFSGNLHQAGPGRFSLRNLLGQEVYSTSVANSSFVQVEFNASEMPAGIYFAEFTTGSARSVLRIFIPKE